MPNKKETKNTVKTKDIKSILIVNRGEIACRIIRTLKRLGIKSGALADRLPTLTIAAKNLATEMTNYNVEQYDLQGEAKITTEHVQNNRSVRSMLGQRGIKPEELPPAEDIKKVERRVSKDEKEIQKGAKKLPKGK